MIPKNKKTVALVSAIAITLILLINISISGGRAVAADTTSATTTPLTTSTSTTTTATSEPIMAPPNNSAQNLIDITSVAEASTTATSTDITWTTGQVSNSQVLFGTSTAYTATTTGADLALYHSVPLDNLAPGTTYHFEVSSSNGLSNAISPDETFTTLSALPSTSTTTSLNLFVVPTSSAATITWQTSQPASSEVFYGLTPNYTASTTGEGGASIPMTMYHAVSITGLAPATIYHFAIFSAGANGVPIVISADQEFTTDPAAGS
jgi:hypothetical protein